MTTVQESAGILRARYRVEGICGQGGMSTVYRAWDSDLGRPVALKVLRDDRPQHRARLMREARAQARISHPNVCPIFDVGEDDDRLFVAMQLIEGKRLDLAAQELSLEQKVTIMRDVAQAVHAAHAEGVVHRDLKPANILVESGDDGTHHCWVVDFGLATATEEPGVTASGEIVGSPHYLSPEQAWGLPADRRSDVYALGVTLYEIFSGKLPFPGATSANVLLHVISRSPISLRRISPALPRDLRLIVETCMEKEPERRYESARALAEDLGRWLRGDPIHARAPGISYRILRFLQRRKALAATTFAAILTILIVSAYAVVAVQRERSQRKMLSQLEEHARYVERLIDHDRALPLHDTGPARDRARAEIAAMTLGSDRAADAASILHYARGRAELAVGDYGSAEESLRTAWASGLRTPALGYALARALGERYASELAGAERIAQEPLRRARIEELRGRFQGPILDALREAKQNAEYPAELIEAEELSLRGQFAAAIEKTRRVLLRFPWSNDARLLQARTLLREASAERLAGRYAESEKTLTSVTAVYRDALRLAPSQADIHDGLCEAIVGKMQILSETGGDLRALMQEAADTCGSALVADPRRVDTRVTLSYARMQNALYLTNHGEPHDEEYAAADAEVARALAIAPGDPSALLQAGLVTWQRGGGYADEAVAQLRKAVAADLRSVPARRALGGALLLIFDEGYIRGDDDRPALEEAIRNYEVAAALQPDFGVAYGGIGIGHLHIAEYCILAGCEAESHIRIAISMFQRAITTNRNHASAWTNLGVAWVRLAELRRMQNRSRNEELAEARKAFDESVRLNPDSWINVVWSCKRSIMEAEAADNAGEADAALSAAEGYLERYEELLRSPLCNQERGALYLVRARWSPNPLEARRYIDRAMGHYEEYARANPTNPASQLEMGRLEMMRCRRTPESCRHDRADALLAKALARNPLQERYVEWIRNERP